MANVNDGTQLGTAETISDEYIDPNALVKRDRDLPASAYKVPRSKIVTGPYGQDHGDASEAAPLIVDSPQLRRIAEIERMRDRLDVLRGSIRYANETNTDRWLDARGQSFAMRGVR